MACAQQSKDSSEEVTVGSELFEEVREYLESLTTCPGDIGRGAKDLVAKIKEHQHEEEMKLYDE